MMPVLFALLLLLSTTVANAEPASTPAASAEPVPIASDSTKSPAPAAATRPLTWDWPTFRTSEYVLTSLVGAAAIGVYFYGKPRREPRWTGGILFDDGLRDAVRVRSPRTRDRLRVLADATGMSAILLAVGIDTFLIPLVRGSPHVAGQLFLLDAEAFALNGLITTSSFYLFGRARPSHHDCLRDPAFDPLCNVGVNASFWSGHTALAFTASGLSCAHHAYVKLYGGGAPDALACAGAITLGAATGTFRVLADRHYASDVLVGALMGFGFGYATPTLLHYAQPGPDARRVGLAVTPTQQGLAVSAAGVF